MKTLSSVLIQGPVTGLFFAQFLTIFQGLIVMSAIPDDHVRVCLLLIPEKSNNENGKEEWFYLDIPIDIIKTLCLKPRKYLLYHAWCILGLDVEYESLTLCLGDENGVFNEIDN